MGKGLSLNRKELKLAEKLKELNSLLDIPDSLYETCMETSVFKRIEDALLKRLTDVNSKYFFEKLVANGNGNFDMQQAKEGIYRCDALYMDAILCSTVTKFKLRFYHLSGANKGNTEREEYFSSIADMEKRYNEVFRYELYSLNPTLWAVLPDCCIRINH